MARGKSSTGGSGKRGRPVKKEVKEEVVDDVEDNSGNEDDGQDEEVDKGEGELPSAPESVKSSKKVFLAPKGALLTGWENVEEIRLNHPRSNVKSLFLLCTGNAEAKPEQFQILEVLTMQQETRSWFVDNTVISDGNLYVCTTVDPLFLVLHVLSQSTKTKPIDDHLSDFTWPGALASTIAKHLSQKQLENLADKKGCDDIIAYAYSEEKTLNWLSAKVEKVTGYLLERGISQSESSVSSNFVKSASDSSSKEECARYACEIVSEYVGDSLKRKLYEKFGIQVNLPEKNGLKRKSVVDDEESENHGTTKKTKTEGDVVPLEDYGSKTPGTPAGKTGKVTAKEKALQKGAQGTHSLLKFFAAKSK